MTMVFQHMGRTYNFKRAKAEQCRLLCSRIALKIKGPSKKKKKRSAEEMDCSEGDTYVFACGLSVLMEMRKSLSPEGPAPPW